MNELPSVYDKVKSIARRTFLKDSAMGIGAVALSSLLAAEGTTASSVAQHSGGVIRDLHVPPRAKRVIFLFMAGGPSHVDLFDPKPLLNKMDGKKIPDHLLRDHQQFALIRGLPALKGSPYKFSPTWRVWHGHFRSYAPLGDCGG